MALTIDPSKSPYTGSTWAGWSAANACPYCGMLTTSSHSMGEKDGRYEWRDVRECAQCGWRREEIRSLPLRRVYGKEA